MTSTAPLLMPKLGLTMTEGTLTEWLVSVGGHVNKGDVMFTVETDKIVNEVEARDEGEITSIDVEAGSTVPVGAVLGTWTGPGDTVDVSPKGGGASEEPVLTSATEGDATGERKPVEKRPKGTRIIATPLARRTAAGLNLDLSDVEGTGPKGRIKAIDVKNATAAERTSLPSERGKSRPATSIQSTIARRLTQSKQTIPHFYVMADVDVTKLTGFRNELNAGQGNPTRVTFNHLVLLAMARALAAMPHMNAVWNDGNIVTFDTVDIGLAVDTPRGLMAPVLRDVGELGITAIVARTNELIEKARAGSVAQQNLVGGAMTVSNVGMFGATALIPIINPGQSAILGVGAVKEIFRPDDGGQPRLCKEASLVLSCDHRVFDGVAAARFLDRIRSLLEMPLQLVLH